MVLLVGDREARKMTTEENTTTTTKEVEEEEEEEEVEVKRSSQRHGRWGGVAEYDARTHTHTR